MVRRVAQPRAWFIGFAAILTFSPATAQQPAPQGAVQIAGLSRAATEISRDCKVKSAYGSDSALRSLRKALRSRRTIKVLAIGSSSTVGVGASSPAATYPVRLESDLEKFLPGVDVQVTNRGISGEVGQDAAERIKLEIAELGPDLVVWQVGTNDALARIDETEFAEMLRSTLRWLAANHIDVVLIDPQYVERLAKDEHYTNIVKAIADVAGSERALLVHRYDTMADLARQRGNGDYLARDRFHLNDLGYRCMAEYAARAIAAGILQADAELAPNN